MRPQSLRVAGHFGELLQGRIGRDGPVALVTLPCPALGVVARRCAATGLSLHGAGQRLLSPQRARALLEKLRLPVNGRFVLRAEMPAGGGAGVSTASLVALAQLAGWQGPPDLLARACVAVEGASDPLMFVRPETRLWASRIGETLAQLPALPVFEVIGGFYGPPKRTNPADSDFPDISDLLPDWTAAALAQDLAALAALASISARRTMECRGAGSDPIWSLAADLGALGYVIAHTGAARGLIFAPGAVPTAARQRLQQAGLRGVVQFRAGGDR
ncbi:MAG: propanediol utilization protein [Cypionkella sp.]|uniref:propanediol utilization protein n=1 Tax=Cypionkella sp. TaxID=2811411 RepID=UPI002AB80CF2|nr:propanediol utilization protein [Cypionkella sp.]MDZ4311116.1 propanediol utilization protein [Cypionkella sp.]